MLEDVLGARSKVRILRAIATGGDRQWSVEELGGATGLSNGTIVPAVKQLVAQGVLKVDSTAGNRRRVGLSPKHPAAQLLAGVFRAETVSVQQATEFLVERADKQGVRYVAWLNNPTEADSARQTVWLFVIADRPEKVQKRWAKEVERRPWLHLDVRSADELKQALRDPQSQYRAIIDQAQVVYADAKWLGAASHVETGKKARQ